MDELYKYNIIILTDKLLIKWKHLNLTISSSSSMESRLEFLEAQDSELSCHDFLSVLI